MPSLRLAYAIEQYTKGAITIYDWLDHPGAGQEQKNMANKIVATPKAQKNSR
jgi:hypothetical protein